jgi:hypothetical protein
MCTSQSILKSLLILFTKAKLMLLHILPALITWTTANESIFSSITYKPNNLAYFSTLQEHLQSSAATKTKCTYQYALQSLSNKNKSFL